MCLLLAVCLIAAFVPASGSNSQSDPTSSSSAGFAVTAEVVSEPVISGTSDFAQTFNPSYIEASEGTSRQQGLLIRAQNCSNCGFASDPIPCCRCAGEGRNASVLLFAPLLSAEPPRFGPPHQVFGPQSAADQRGTEDPRVALDKRSGVYYMMYTAWSHSGTASLALASSKDPTDPDMWQRHGLVGFGADSKSGALLIRESTPHYLIWGAGTIHISQSSDLLKWTPGREFITGTPFGNNHVEAGPPPLVLESGHLLLLFNSWDDENVYSPTWAVLNGTDPTQILAMAASPLIHPTLPWMVGSDPYPCNVPNVAFLEAAVRTGPNTFRVYLGGADASVGTAVVTVTEPA